jgi:hypothetical protein
MILIAILPLLMALLRNGQERVRIGRGWGRIRFCPPPAMHLAVRATVTSGFT